MRYLKTNYFCKPYMALQHCSLPPYFFPYNVNGDFLYWVSEYYKDISYFHKNTISHSSSLLEKSQWLMCDMDF